MYGIYLSTGYRSILIMTYDNKSEARRIVEELSKKFTSDRFEFKVDDIPHNKTLEEAMNFMNQAFTLVENLTEYMKKNS